MSQVYICNKCAVQGIPQQYAQPKGWVRLNISAQGQLQDHEHSKRITGTCSLDICSACIEKVFPQWRQMQNVANVSPSLEDIFYGLAVEAAEEAVSGSM